MIKQLSCLSIAVGLTFAANALGSTNVASTNAVSGNKLIQLASYQQRGYYYRNGRYYYRNGRYYSRSYRYRNGYRNGYRYARYPVYRSNNRYNSYRYVKKTATKKRYRNNKPAKKYYSKNKVFIFNPRTKRWAAYANGKLVRSGRASGGKGYCKDVGRSCRTPVGSFRVSRKGGPGCASSKYPLGRGGAPMPYCMFFLRSYAIHGSPDVPNYNASHGCIRVLPSAARWLSRNFITHGTRVVVKSY